MQRLAQHFPSKKKFFSYYTEKKTIIESNKNVQVFHRYTNQIVAPSLLTFKYKRKKKKKKYLNLNNYCICIKGYKHGKLMLIDRFDM